MELMGTKLNVDTSRLILVREIKLKPHCKKGKYMIRVNEL